MDTFEGKPSISPTELLVLEADRLRDLAQLPALRALIARQAKRIADLEQDVERLERWLSNKNLQSRGRG